MKCPFCSLEFQEDESTECKGCNLFGQCGKIKCPRCGYKIVPDPVWAGKIRKILKTGKEDKI